MSLDATVSGASSNSYVTQAEATAYFGDRLNSSTWTSASSANKDAALITATMRIDQEIFVGTRTSSTQALKWPRYNVPVVGEQNYYWNYYPSDAIPAPVKKAVYEYALELLTSDTLPETNLSGYKSLKVGPISVDFNQPVGSGLLPDMVSRLLRGLRIASGSMVRA